MLNYFLIQNKMKQTYKVWYNTTQQVNSIVHHQKNFLSLEEVNMLRSMYDGNGETEIKDRGMRKRIFDRVKEVALENGLDVVNDALIVSNTRYGDGHVYHRDNSKTDTCGNIIPNHTPSRMVSMSVSLTDPKTYTGGTFHIFPKDGKKQSYRLKMGDAIIFSSHHKNPHWVDPVTQGERMVLLCWMKSKHNFDGEIVDGPTCIWPLCVVLVICFLCLVGGVALYWSRRRKK